VNDETGANEELADEIAGIFAGPLEGFISRRDSVVKELRAAGRRSDAIAVKGLRKPARTAWALNAASLDGPETIERVAIAAAAARVAHAGAGDLRGTMSELRRAVQSLAEEASRAGAAAGYAADPALMANAVMAVIGTPGAFETLRAGRLVDIPEAGGLDVLTGPTSDLATAAHTTVEPAADRAAEAATREAIRRASVALAAARERSVAAEQALRDAEANAETAERQLVLAQEEALARQAERDRARKEAADAAEQVRQALETLE
jgi:hypothetical protein